MSRHISPTAQLLRSSRLFSLPQPLPPPPRSSRIANRTASHRTSDTATTRYPTHQAISTPDSSLRRGDWGLKRPLPVRETSDKVKPFVRTVARLTDLDTIERITDYETASDLEKTWEKFQEMRIAIIRDDLTRRSVRFDETKSAFEPAYDYTDKYTAPKSNPDFATPTRWKFQAPSLGNMSRRDFDDFVANKLQRERAEFDSYLRAHVTRIYINNRRNETQKRVQDGRAPMQSQEGEPLQQPQENESDDAAQLITLEYLNWLCQLPDMADGTLIDSGLHYTWDNYKMRMMLYGMMKPVEAENSEAKNPQNPGLWLYLDQISTERGREHVKESLFQMLNEISDAEYSHMLREIRPKHDKNDVHLPVQYQRSRRKAYLARISSNLPATIPRDSFLSTTVEKLIDLSREESTSRIANILFSEWEFFTTYNAVFEQRYLDWLVKERGNTTVTSPLNTLIRNFLDMPPQSARALDGKSDGKESERWSTHPSAGLSYLQTNAFLDNHPILGPQAARAPFDARVLSPRSADGAGKVAHLGIGGFVVSDPIGITGHIEADQSTAKLDMQADGGAKILMAVHSARVDRYAAIHLKAERPKSKDQEEIKQGKLTPSILDSYRKQTRVDGNRIHQRLDSGSTSKEASTSHASVARLLGMLNKSKEMEESA